jgi:hypothetical protein
MGFFSIGKNLLIIYVCINLIGVWLFGARFTGRLGFLVIIVLALSVYVLLQKTGIAPSHK